MYWQIGYGFIPVVLLLLVASSLRILREYQRGVVFQLGRFWKVKGPGLVILIPGIQQMVRVDLRTIVMDVPPQDVITRDNVSVKVNAVVYFRVIDPQRAVIQVEDFLMAKSTRLPARTAARVGNRPAAPTIAAITASQSGCDATSASACGPDRITVASWSRRDFTVGTSSSRPTTA